MTAKVWVLGDAVVDLIPAESGGELLMPCPGGAPANVAVGVARLGGNSAFIGRVGDDPFGQMMMRTLARERVDVRYMTLDGFHRTSTVLVALNDAGERTFTFMVRPGADLFLQTGDLPAFGPGEWLHLCSIALSAEPSRSAAFAAMDAVKRAGGFVSVDPNIREDLWQDPALLKACLHRALTLADVVKLSMEELLFLTGGEQDEAAIQGLAAAYGTTLLLVTEGKEGVRVCWRGAVRRYRVEEVESVDTTGAGDAFVAGLLAGLAERGFPDSDAALAPLIAQAQACGALAVTARGAMTALPRREALARFC
ncbi:aminoimidazole riboside kinase [Pluralibacter gergoviae]